MNWILFDGDVQSLVLLYEVMQSFGRENVRLIAPTFGSYRRDMAVRQLAMVMMVPLERFESNGLVFYEAIREVLERDEGLVSLFVPFKVSAFEVAAIFEKFRGKLMVHSVELGYEDAWKLAVGYGLPVELTYSCEGNDGHCGWCEKCKLRKEMVKKYGPAGFGELCERTI